MNVLVMKDLALNRELLRNILAGAKPDGDVVETSTSVQQISNRDGFSAQAMPGDTYQMISIIIMPARQGNARTARELGLHGEMDLPVLQFVLPGNINTVLAQGEKESFAAKPLIHKTPSEVGLTARQANVLALIVQGKSNKAIGRLLDSAEPTVKNHVTAILRALKATNRTEAAIIAKERGWKLPMHSPKNSRSRTSALPQVAV